MADMAWALSPTNLQSHVRHGTMSVGAHESRTDSARQAAQGHATSTTSYGVGKHEAVVLVAAVGPTLASLSSRRRRRTQARFAKMHLRATSIAERVAEVDPLEPLAEPKASITALEVDKNALKLSLNELADSTGTWVTVAGVPVMRPPSWAAPRGVIHFIGGAFFGSAPQWTYRSLLAELSQLGFWIIATPTATSFDHMRLVASTTESFEQVYESISQTGLLDTSLPVYGAGHSLGALLSTLIGCGGDRVPASYSARLRGQILISFNAQSLDGAVPLWKEVWTKEDFRPAIGDLASGLEAVGSNKMLQEAAERAFDASSFLLNASGLKGGAAVIGDATRVRELYKPFLDQLGPLFKDVESGIDDFTPGEIELNEQIFPTYPSTLPVLMVRFEGDAIDQTATLEKVLKERSPSGDVKVVELTGTHVSPNYAEPPELIDGTDAFSRTAIGQETAIDAALLSFGAQLAKLVKTIDEYLPAAEVASTRTFLENAGVVARENGSPARLVLKDLQTSDFRHPLDLRQTRTLERIPGLGNVIRQAVAVVEQAVYQDNISTSTLVGEKSYAWIHQKLNNACDILAIPEADRPEVYIKLNPVPNAYTLAVRGKRPFVVLHTALLDLCSEEEVEAVIAHELGHLKCEHSLWMTAANILVLFASTLPINPSVLGPLLEQVQDQLLVWQRAAELTCDRAALLVAQEPWVPLSVLVKLSGGGSAKTDGDAPLSRERIEAFLDQATLYDEAQQQDGPLGAMIGSLMRGGRPLTHPLPVLRAREMRRWASSDEFQRLIRKKGVTPKVDGERLPDMVTEVLGEHFILDESKKGEGVVLEGNGVVKNTTKSSNPCAPGSCRIILGKDPLPQGRHCFRVRLVKGAYYYIGVAEEGVNLNSWLGSSRAWSYYLRDDRSGSRLGPGYKDFGPRLLTGETVTVRYDSVAGTVDIAQNDDELKPAFSGLAGKELFLALGMGPNDVTLQLEEVWRDQ